MSTYHIQLIIVGTFHSEPQTSLEKDQEYAKECTNACERGDEEKPILLKKASTPSVHKLF
jgi:hypothetical protein